LPKEDSSLIGHSRLDNWWGDVQGHLIPAQTPVARSGDPPPVWVATLGPDLKKEAGSPVAWQPGYPF